MYRGRGRGVQGNGMLYMLAVHAASKFMQLPRKPPVTAALILLQTLIYLRPGQLDKLLPTVSEVCLNPYIVLKDWDLKRLWLSAFYHVDESHLVYNMISLMWKGVQLEGMLGSKQFAVMVTVLLGLSHGLVVVASSLLARFTESTGPLYSECSVGFSGVLFALKVVLNWNSPSHTNVYGVLVPSRYSAWVELAVIQMFVPGTSFLGHLCGILAGVIYMYSPRVLSGSLGLSTLISGSVSMLSWPFRRLWGPLFARSRIYSRGTLGSRRNSRYLPDASLSRRQREGQPNGRDGLGVWRCDCCTYDNSLAVEACDMCGNRRGSEARLEGEDATPTPSAPSWSLGGQRSASPSLSREEVRRARLARFSG